MFLKAEAADGNPENPVAPAAEGSVPTRLADEVSGGIEQPDAKKPKVWTVSDLRVLLLSCILSILPLWVSDLLESFSFLSNFSPQSATEAETAEEANATETPAETPAAESTA